MVRRLFPEAFDGKRLALGNTERRAMPGDSVERFLTVVVVSYTGRLDEVQMPKSLMVPLWLAVLAVPLSAQRPPLSPHETHSFTVEGTTIAFEYGRPSKRGREIWGGLVPWGRWWMPGADKATIVTTDAPIVFAGGLVMPAGQHTLYMLPDPDAPKLIVNNQVGQFHTSYSPARDLGRVDLSMKKLPAIVEQLTYSAEATSSGGVLKLTWDDRGYSVEFALKK